MLTLNPLLLASALALVLIAVVLAWFVAGQSARRAFVDASAQLDALREQLRTQADALARQNREELADAVARSGAASVHALGEVVRGNSARLDSLAASLQHDAASAREATAQQALSLRTEMLDVLASQRREMLESVVTLSQRMGGQLGEAFKSQKDHLEVIDRQLRTVADGNEKRLEALRGTVDTQLTTLQAANDAKLEEIRQTVTERLQTTLDQRLGESFKLVSDRLEQVHKGLGEMQSLASGVGDLKRVMSNVQSRGAWGEVQLRALLDQVLSPEQYGINVRCNESTTERVEFAVKFPGRGDTDQPVWLPIDSKFPLEDYDRLAQAAERADLDGVEAAAKALEIRVKASAREIQSKYINPPTTTDVAILFLPTEGLYAEVLRRPGLADAVQRDHHVTIAGPSTLWALLNSLQMGFRTLAIQRRSSEVWQLLGKVKTDFDQFGHAVDLVQKKLDEASNKISEVRKGSRRIERTLRDVQAIDRADQAVLELRPPDPDEEADPDPQESLFS